MYPLKLAINPQNWELYMRRKADPAFGYVRDKIFVRDQYMCQFCGFQAKEFQEIVNVDGNYRHNELSNMVTACPFCSQCLFIESIGQHDIGGGKLVYLPEMPQAELNSLCHVLFCALFNGTTYQETAQTIYRTLRFRSQAIEDKFGEGTSEPYIFARLLLEQEGDPSQLAEKLLVNFRLLPSYAKFKRQLEKWSLSAAEELVARKT